MSDLDFAKREARSATEDVLNLLKTKWRVSTCGLGVQNEQLQFSDDLKSKLLEVMEEIFVSDSR